MAHLHKLLARPARSRLLAVVLLAGAGAGLIAGIAVARSFYLRVAKHASVTNVENVTRHETIVVGPHGRPVYTLSGEGPHHLECVTAACFAFWPPVTIGAGKALNAQPGVRGKLGRLHRDGFTQVTLGGRPLYYYAPDSKDSATGEGIVSFGGTWHVVKAKGKGGHGSTSTTTTPTTTTVSSSSSGW